MKRTVEQDGQWIQPVCRDYELECCDCGLVHRMNFRVVRGRAQYQPFRDNRKTAATRRERRERQAKEGK